MTVKEGIEWQRAFAKTYGGSPGNVVEAVSEACNMAIEALQKRELQAPIWESDGDADGAPVYDVWYCPTCDTAYTSEVRYNCCPRCGQRINWDEQED